MFLFLNTPPFRSVSALAETYCWGPIRRTGNDIFSRINRAAVIRVYAESVHSAVAGAEIYRDRIVL